jgi:fatty-acyl-CoA synthase/long-chain acyl-CoA synthetase
MYTLGDIPRGCAINFRDNIAVEFEGKRYTYFEFNNRINRFVNALAALGFNKGGRLAVMADNCSKYLEVYFAAAKIGMSVTPVNVRLGDDEIVYVATDSEVSLFVVGDGYEEKVNSMKAKLTNVKTWITLNNSSPGFLDYESLLEKSSAAEPDVDMYDVKEDDMAILMYTGGTTGLPKGVMLTHRSAMMSGLMAALYMEMTQEDSTCFVLPIFHVSWWPILMILAVGGKVCIVRKPNLDVIFKLIQVPI